MVDVRLSSEQGAIQLRDSTAEQAANGLKEIEEIEFTDIKSAV